MEQHVGTEEKSEEGGKGGADLRKAPLMLCVVCHLLCAPVMHAQEEEGVLQRR